MKESDLMDSSMDTSGPPTLIESDMGSSASSPTKGDRRLGPLRQNSQEDLSSSAVESEKNKEKKEVELLKGIRKLKIEENHDEMPGLKDMSLDSDISATGMRNLKIEENHDEMPGLKDDSLASSDISDTFEQPRKPTLMPSKFRPSSKPACLKSSSLEKGDVEIPVEANKSSK